MPDMEFDLWIKNFLTGAMLYRQVTVDGVVSNLRLLILPNTAFHGTETPRLSLVDNFFLSRDGGETFHQLKRKCLIRMSNDDYAINSCVDESTDNRVNILISDESVIVIEYDGDEEDPPQLEGSTFIPIGQPEDLGSILSAIEFLPVVWKAEKVLSLGGYQYCLLTSGFMNPNDRSRFFLGTKENMREVSILSGKRIRQGGRLNLVTSEGLLFVPSAFEDGGATWNDIPLSEVDPLLVWSIIADCKML